MRLAESTVLILKDGGCCGDWLREGGVEYGARGLDLHYGPSGRIFMLVRIFVNGGDLARDTPPFGPFGLFLSCAPW